MASTFTSPSAPTSLVLTLGHDVAADTVDRDGKSHGDIDVDGGIVLVGDIQRQAAKPPASAVIADAL